MAADYAYGHFEISMRGENRRFTSGVPAGEPFSAVGFSTVEETGRSTADLLGRRPVLLYSGRSVGR